MTIPTRVSTVVLPWNAHESECGATHFFTSLARRSAAFALLCFLVFGSSVIAQQNPNQYAVLLPASGSTIGRIQPFLIGGQTPTPLSAINAPNGVFKIVPMPDGSKYYLIAAQGSGGVATVDPNFQNLNPIAGNLTLAPSDAGMSPDGRRLVVLTSSGVFVIDTSSDLLINVTPITTGGSPLKVAFSNDARRAYVLSLAGNSSSVGTIVTAIDLTAVVPAAIGTNFTANLDLGSPPTGLAVAPTGFIYVTNNYSVLEIDSTTMAGTASSPIGVHAYPGVPAITPNGKYLVAANLRPNQGNTTMVMVDLALKKELDLPQFTNGDQLVQIFPAGVDLNGLDRFYAIGATNNIYDVSLTSTGSLNAAQSSIYGLFNISNPTFANVGFTNEFPPRYMMATSTTGQVLYQLDLKNQVFSTATAGNTLQPMTVVSTPPGLAGGVASVVAFNNNQTVNSSFQTTYPLVAKLLDSQGRGVFKGQITFTSTQLGVVIANPVVTTTSNGFGQTTVTLPNVPGQYTVTATGAVGISVDFTLTVPGATSGGGSGGGSVNSSTFSVISGNGQVVNIFTGIPAPLVAQLLDANGKPIAGATVTWTVNTNDGSLSLGGALSATSTTDVNGYATINFNSSQSPAGGYSSTSNIVASTGNLALTYYVTVIVAKDPASGISNSLPGADDADACTRANGGTPCVPTNRVLTVTAGQVLKSAYAAYVYVPVGATAGSVLANIGVRAQNFQPPIGCQYFQAQLICPTSSPGDPPQQTTENLMQPYAHCINNPLTDPISGVAKCDLQIGPVLGTNKIYFIIGEFTYFAPITINVTAGPPTVLTKTNGDKQSGNPGTSLTSPLTVQVTDAGGNKLGGVPVTWSVSPANGATLSATKTTTDGNGNTSITAKLGSIPGPVTITASVDATHGVAFTETVQSVVSKISVVSGDNQTTLTSNGFSSPLVVAVTDASGNPVVGNQVSFSATNGATLSAATANTDANGRASVNLTAGPAAGTITVIASIAGLSTSFNNLVATLPGPQIDATSFRNYASPDQQGLTPCGLGVIIGNNIAPGVSGTVQPPGFGPNPTSLGPVQSVTINGTPTPITFVSNINGLQQVGIQTPCEVSPGSANVSMVVQGGSTTVSGVQVLQYQPGMFQTLASDGQYYALALRPDGTFISPSNPALRGERIRMFVTGLGQTTPALVTNSAGTGGQIVLATLVGGVNNVGVAVEQAEYVAGQIGRYFVDITIPLDTLPGPYQPIVVAVQPLSGPLVFGNGVNIPIQ